MNCLWKYNLQEYLAACGDVYIVMKHQQFDMNEIPVSNYQLKKLISIVLQCL